MPLLRRVSSLLLVALLLVVGASCGHRAYRVVTSPTGRRAATSTSTSTSTSSTTTSSVPSTTVPVPAPHLVVPPRQQPTAEGDYHLFIDWPIWRALGRCEEGGGMPPDGIRWDHDGAAHVSGFGMARTTFNMDAHAVGLPDWHVGYPPADQIVVARYGRAHRQHWGCSVRVAGW